jgi:hypothetical protein
LTRIRHVLPPLYILALYVAAACHDVGHKCVPAPLPLELLPRPGCLQLDTVVYSKDHSRWLLA